jgi:FkbM family methyltransferase
MPRARAVRLVSHLGARRLSELETLFQLAQGKGWGATTVAQETAAVSELLGHARDENLVILDVGANVGSWTLQALNTFPRAQIHAFEPSASAFAELTVAVGDVARASAHRLALGNTDGEAVLYADSPGSGLASLTKRRLDHFGLQFSFEEAVRVSTLESWSKSSGISEFDVLKLDVEGHEMEVLRGAGRLLERVRVIQFEFGGCNIDTGTYLQDFWYFLTGTGFKLHRLGPAGLAPMEHYSERDEAFTTTNFFARRYRP